MDITTMKQGLQETFGILNGISVPMALLQQIGVPILKYIVQNLEEEKKPNSM